MRHVRFGLGQADDAVEDARFRALPDQQPVGLVGEQAVVLETDGSVSVVKRSASEPSALRDVLPEGSVDRPGVSRAG